LKSFTAPLSSSIYIFAKPHSSLVQPKLNFLLVMARVLLLRLSALGLCIRTNALVKDTDARHFGRMIEQKAVKAGEIMAALQVTDTDARHFGKIRLTEQRVVPAGEIMAIVQNDEQAQSDDRNETYNYGYEVVHSARSHDDVRREAGRTESNGFFSRGLHQKRKQETSTDFEVTSGIWQPRKQKMSDSMCVDGRLVPQLYLLGAPKSSTTTLATELMHAGVQSVHDENSVKEFHFFDGRMNWRYTSPEELEDEKQEWLRTMPKCPASVEDGGRREVLADFTPDYLRMVEMPEQDDLVGTFPPWPWSDEEQPVLLGRKPEGAIQDVNLPPLLQTFYGNDNARRISFVALLREPLARMQSAWYHAQSFDFTNECVDCKSDSFLTSLQTHLDGFSLEKKQLTDWLWTGMYGLHLQGWLKTFSPDQFLVIPYKELMYGDKDQVCRRLAVHVSLFIGCQSNGQDIMHEWSHEHPPLEEDAPQEMRDRFNELFLWQRDYLVWTLTEGLRDGMVLANYYGKGDRETVQTWLLNGW